MTLTQGPQALVQRRILQRIRTDSVCLPGTFPASVHCFLTGSGFLPVFPEADSPAFIECFPLSGAPRTFTVRQLPLSDVQPCPEGFVPSGFFSVDQPVRLATLSFRTI